MNYNIQLFYQEELTIDIGDLEGIIQQLEAITQGWGMDFDCIDIDEEPSIEYTKGTSWLNNPKEDIYTLEDGEPIK